MVVKGAKASSSKSSSKAIRPSKAEYYLNIAEQVAKRSTCMRTRHGCVIVKNDQIVATGYTGAPRKTMDCAERGNCIRSEMKIPSGQRYEICRSVHSEQNALINAARSGVSLFGGDLFLFSLKVFEGKEEVVNALPCFICKKMIINAGISRVISRQADGSMKIYDVNKWTEDWQKHDMLDDVNVYDSKYYKKNDNKKPDPKKADEPKMVIGLTGTFGAGKGAVAEELKKSGFTQLIMSDVLREECKKAKIEESRDNLLAMGNKLRSEFGSGILMKRLLEKASKSGYNRVVIDGLRSTGEVDELKKSKGILIAVDAPIKTRYERISARKSSKDNITFKQFIEQELNEISKPGAQLNDCIKMADIVIKNTGSMSDLQAKVSRMISDIKKKT